MFANLKKAFSKSLAQSIAVQKKTHKGYHIFEDIHCSIEEDSKGIYVRAILQTTNPHAGGNDISGIIRFYKQYIDTYYNAVNLLSKEVSEATFANPEFNFFRDIVFVDDDAVFYSSPPYNNLNSEKKSNWFYEALNKPNKECHVYEQYVNGSWISADPPEYQRL